MLEFDLLSAFVAVAECGGAAASHAIDVSQQTKRLELDPASLRSWACLLAQTTAQTVEGLAESLVVMSADKTSRSQG
jgi:hypothetical protein